MTLPTAQLRGRGLSDAAIERAGYASLPLDAAVRRAAVAAVLAATGLDDLAVVPGFYQREGASETELAGAPGLLIPVRDPDGLACGVRIRCDNPLAGADGKPRGKYRWLSAPSTPGVRGCGPGARVHVPSHDAACRRDVQRITEGELKAEIATERTNMLTLSAPGVAMFPAAAEVAVRMGAKRLVFAPDADTSSNEHVGAALQRGMLRGAQLVGAERVALEVWPADAGKGIDDVLTGPRAHERETLSGTPAWERLRTMVAASGATVDPAVEAYVVLGGIDARLAADPNGTAFAPDVLCAAGVLRRVAKADYEALVSRIKKAGVRTREWEREVRKEGRDVPRARHAGRAALPAIEIRVDEAAVVAEAMAALAAAEIFDRGGALTQVVRDGGLLDGVTRPTGRSRIALVSPARLRELCSATARYLRPAQEGDGQPSLVEDHPPQWLVLALHQRAQWDHIRYLEAVVEWPVLRPDGTVLATPGYDAATGLLYVPGCHPPVVPDLPTASDVARAVDLLVDAFWDFPFASPAHRAACLAALLTPFARYAFSGPAPLMLIDKNTRGAGGSLLADVVGEIVAGRSMARMAPSPSDEEERKRITSLALSGDLLVLIDNVAGPFGSAALDAALTATVWQDRLLGASQVVRLPLATTWFATGNNITLVGDTSRRCLHIRLETPEERPELRAGFRHDPLLPWVRSQRSPLMGAALTLLRAYIVAGRPKMGLPAWGSFDGWSGLVRACLVWAGLPDPGETRLELQADADDVAGALADLVAGWEEAAAAFGGRCTVAQLLAALEDDYEKRRFPQLRAALDELVPTTPGQLPNARRVGNALKKFRGRVVGGKALAKAGGRGEGGNVWTVRAVTAADATPPTAAPSPAAATAASAATASAPRAISGANGAASAVPGRAGEAAPTTEAGDAGDAAGAPDGAWEVRL